MPSLNGISSLRLTWNSVATLKDIYKVHVKGSVSSINILTELIYGKSSIAPVRGWCRERIFQAAGGRLGGEGGGAYSVI